MLIKKEHYGHKEKTLKFHILKIYMKTNYRIFNRKLKVKCQKNRIK